MSALKPERVPAEVLTSFGLPADAVSEPIVSGHINRTFLIDGGARGRRVLQWINGTVFPAPMRLCRNTYAVSEWTRHARRGADDLLIAEQFAADTGEPFAVDAAGEVWRATDFIPSSSSLPALRARPDAAALGSAFGRFLALAAGFPEAGFVPAIPDFHALAPRLVRYDVALAADAHDRAAGIADVQETIAALRELLVALPFAALPRRLVHGDCKIGNALFATAANGEALARVIAVVDLDTVMVATRLFDFADLVRSACAVAPEDEQDTARVGVHEGHLAAIAQAFFSASGTPLTAAEEQLRIPACAYIAFMLGVRFATDHLEADLYFGVQRPGQNADRARAQLRMARLYWDARERLAAQLPTS